MDLFELLNRVRSRPVPEQRILLARWSLRGLPVALAAARDDGRGGNRIALYCCRAIIANIVAGVVDYDEPTGLLPSSSADDVTLIARMGGEFAHIPDAVQSAGGRHSDATDMTDFIFLTLDTDSVPFVTMGGQVATFFEDTLALVTHDNNLDRDQFQTRKLWHGEKVPDTVLNAWATFSNHCNVYPEWSFWRDWYQGFLDGEPLDWNLQMEIALIPDAEWEKGPKRIAALIEEIRARFDLGARIADLEAELATATQSRLAIGGNNPPEPIETAPAIAPELVIIWAPLQVLKAETDAESPDKTKIELAIEALGKVLKTGLRWCAEKADLVVDTIIVSAIKWAVPVAATGYLALNPDKITAVIDAASVWLQTLF